MGEDYGIGSLFAIVFSSTAVERIGTRVFLGRLGKELNKAGQSQPFLSEFST
jgi:hypothetical protein